MDRYADVRVASIPGAHPFVAGLGLAQAGVSVLDDPPVAGAPRGRWWPPAMLDPAWIERCTDDFDVMHLHFGMDSRPVSELRLALTALRTVGRPLVYTAHDLSNPQLSDQDEHLAALGVVLDAADTILTLTPGAAAEIARRWGRRAHVLPHPAIVPPEVDSPEPDPPSRARGRLIGVHLRDLRPGIDGPGTVAAVAAAADGVAADGLDVRVRVWINDRVRDPASAALVRDRCEASARCELVRRPRPDDRALWAEVAGLDVAVLPYRHGSHSGWLEMCWDLAVPVVVPTFGHFAEQHRDLAFARAVAPGDGDGLSAALRSLLQAVGSRPASADRRDARAARREQRRAQRAELGAAHLAVYREVIG